MNNASQDPIMSHLVENPVSSEILYTIGSSATLAVRCYIVPYAENVMATWVMLAVKWRAANQ
jgi:hypothetical protein